MNRRRNLTGLCFVLPWLVGLGLFILYPFLASIGYGLTNWSVLREPEWVGLGNFSQMARDAVFWQSLKVVLLYAAFSIPLGVLAALALAVMLSAARRGVSIYRAIYYLPQLVPTVVVAILWFWLFNSKYGVVNTLLRPVLDGLNAVTGAGLEEPTWLASTRWALWVFVFMSLWQIGQMTIIYLAKIQDVPQELYEAAELDGAGFFGKLRHVTLPQISPIILFNVIMSVILAFQVFTEPYVITRGEGGPARATHFLSLYIYNLAFKDLRMGYACAISFVLFLLILGLTVLALRIARGRVYYAGRE